MELSVRADSPHFELILEPACPEMAEPPDIVPMAPPLVADRERVVGSTGADSGADMSAKTSSPRRPVNQSASPAHA